MAPKLKALEKNILKYRALQMILLLHEMESLKEFIIGSIKSTDKIMTPFTGNAKELPEGTRMPFKKALDILVEKQIITDKESSDIQRINDTRNTIGHAMHELVDDISNPDRHLPPSTVYDYDALDRLEKHRAKIEKELGKSYIMSVSFRGVDFEQAELTYKEELSRLRSKIDRQYEDRRDESA